MNSTNKLARLAGFLYVLLSVPGVYALIYVPKTLMAHGDPAATAHNILASETLFRSGILADLVSQALFILVGLVLYRLLKGVDKTLAALTVILLLIPIPIVFVGEVHHLSVLTILDANGPAAALSEAQRYIQMSLALDSYDNAILVAEVFWGLWLFPFGWLVFKSGFLPRVLGVLLIVAGCGYAAESVAWLLLPDYGHLVSKVAGPLRALELLTPLWMLIMGAKDKTLAD
ncbi:MAG TPA: DUF4386 domain-containing protein [Gammaproteobacteria bacterium]|nr:DUF4386 domain-containing protein [Gammaproteobacteria bacterium]